MDIAQLNEKIKQESAFVDLLFSEIGKVIVGQKEMVERLVVGLLGNGHILLEGVPGIAKTVMAKLPLKNWPTRLLKIKSQAIYKAFGDNNLKT